LELDVQCPIEYVTSACESAKVQSPDILMILVIDLFQGHIGENPFDNGSWGKEHFQPSTVPWQLNPRGHGRPSDDGIMDHDTDGDGAINLSTSQRPSAATTPNGDTPTYGQDQQDNDQMFTIDEMELYDTWRQLVRLSHLISIGDTRTRLRETSSCVTLFLRRIRSGDSR
ncbi:hypothetical protein HN011_008430, partial [Eciton burchellii]